MAEPKKKTSKRRKNIRRKNHGEDSSNFKKCVKCGKDIKPHTICSNCGTYNK